MNVLILDNDVWNIREKDTSKIRGILMLLDYVYVRLGMNKYVVIKNKYDGKVGHTIDRARLEYELIRAHNITGSERYQQ